MYVIYPKNNSEEIGSAETALMDLISEFQQASIFQGRCIKYISKDTEKIITG